MTGSPCAVCSTLFDESMSVRASICASSEMGTCTAIWSPSKSALNAAHTSGCSWIALPSISTGSNAWMPRRCSVGARLSSTGCSRITSSRMSHTTGSWLSTMRLAALMVVASPITSSLWKMKGLKSSSAMSLGSPHWWSFSVGPDHDHRAARVVDALAEQVLAEAPALALDHVGERLERALVGARHRLAAPAVVEQRVHRFLEHALLVAHDDLRAPSAPAGASGGCCG